MNRRNSNQLAALPDADLEYPPPRYSFVERESEEVSQSIPPSYTSSVSHDSSSPQAQSASGRNEISGHPETSESSDSSFLHVYHDAHNRFTVFDSNQALVLFVAELHHVLLFSDKYELSVHSQSADGPIVGTSTIDAANHTFSLNIHDASVPIAKLSPSFEADEVFDIPPSEADSTWLRWESRDVAKGDIDLVLQASESGECWARIVNSAFKTKEAEIEIKNNKIPPAMFEKVLVSGLAMVMLLKKRKAKQPRRRSRTSPAMRDHFMYIASPN